MTLPICYLAPEKAHISEPIRVHFPPEWNDYLLHRAVATRTKLRPEGFDSYGVLDLFSSQLAGQLARSVPMPVSPRTTAVATRFLTKKRMPNGMALGAEIQRAFRSRTGLTISQWCRLARLEVARELLASGTRPTDAARKVGYTRARSFSRAFRAMFGRSPREYLTHGN